MSHDHATTLDKWKQKAWEEYERDPQFCWRCGLRGYQLFSTVLLQQELESDDLTPDERDYLAQALVQIASLTPPPHESQAKGPVS